MPKRAPVPPAVRRWALRLPAALLIAVFALCAGALGANAQGPIDPAKGPLNDPDAALQGSPAAQDGADGVAPAAPDLMGGGLPTNGYYRFIDSDEPPNPPGVVPPTPNFINISASGTAVVLGDDACTPPIPLDGETLPADDDLPFYFVYHDLPYQEVFICSNGLLSFGGPFTSFNNACPPLASSPGGIIMPYWDDLYPPAGGRILWDVQGTFPNRTFIVQWEQISHISEFAETYIFQVQLLERTSNIRFEYFNVESGGPDGVAITPGGQLLVGSSDGDKVIRFANGVDYTANHVRSGLGSLDEPAGMTVGDGTAGGTGDIDGDGADDLFVASFASDRVLVYSGDTSAPALNNGFLIATFVPAVSGGLDGPRDVVYGPDGNLYVTSFNTDEILRYDGTNGSFIDAFVAASSGGLNGPDSLVFGPGGDLFVTSHLTDQVLRYNGATGAFIGVFVAAGSGSLDGPRGLAFHPTDGSLYVASELNDRVVRYSGVNGDFFNVAVAPGQDGLDGPRSIVFDTVVVPPQLVVASFEQNRTLRFDVEPPTFASASLNGPVNMTFAPNGNLHVSNYDNDSTVRVDGTTGASLGTFVASGSGGLNGPRGMVYGPDGSLYVASELTDQVLRYNGTTGTFIDAFVTDNPLTLLVDEDGGLDGPIGIAFGSDGNLYVASSNTDEVKRYQGPGGGTPGAYIGNFVTAGSGGLNRPTGIRFDGSGRLLVSSFLTDQVLRYTAGGAFDVVFVTAGSGGLNEPEELVFGAGGNLFVASRANDRVLAYDDATFAFLGVYAQTTDPFDQPIGLAYGPSGSPTLKMGAYNSDLIRVAGATLTDTVFSGGTYSAGRSATVGLDGPGSGTGLQYGCNPGSGTGAPFLHEDLAILFRAPPPPGADLEVVYKRTDQDECYNEGDTVIFEIKVQNNGRDAATSVTVDDQLPDGLMYVSSVASQGAYNPLIGIWTIGNLAVDQMETLFITLTIDAGTASDLGRFREEFVVADNPPVGRLIDPEDIEFGPDGNYYVSSFGRNQVLRYDPAGTFIDIFVPSGSGGLAGAAGMAFFGGDLYVASSTTNQILRYQGPAGPDPGDFVAVHIENATATPLFPDGLFRPLDLVFDGTGRAYVTSSLNSQVRRYSPAGVFQAIVGAAFSDPFAPGFPASTLNLPHSLIFGPDYDGDTFDDLYVASQGSSEIIIFSGNPGAPAHLANLVSGGDGGIGGPTYLALGPNNGLLVSSSGSNSVLRYDALTGEFKGEAVTPQRGGLIGPHGLYVDEINGRLYVVSQGTHQVLRYSLTGSGALVAVIDSNAMTSDLDFPRAVTVADDQLFVAHRDGGATSNIEFRRYTLADNSAIGVLGSFNASSAAGCGIFGGTVSEVYDIVVVPGGERMYVSFRVACSLGGSRTAVAAVVGPDDIVDAGDLIGLIALDVQGFSFPDDFLDMTIGPDGLLYVARDGNPGSVMRFNATTGGFVDTFIADFGLNRPYGLLFDSDGNLLVSDENDDDVNRYQGPFGASPGAHIPFPPGTFVTAGSGGLNGPQGMVFGADGNLHVASFDSDAILRYNGETGASMGVFTSASLDGPSGITLATDGDLIVASRNNQQINRYDSAFTFLGVFAEVTPDGLNCATYLTFGPDRNGDGYPELYVSAEHQDVVKLYNGMTGAYISDFASTGLDGPQDLEFGPDGHLYVASLYNDRVVRFNGTTGAFIDVYVPRIGLNAPDGPIGIAFGPHDGHLYVAAGNGNQILRFIGPGGFLGFFLGGYPFSEPFVAFAGTPAIVAPQDIVFGPDGNGDGIGELFVSSPQGVFRYDGELGTFIDIFASDGGLAGARGLVFGADGDLYVASSATGSILQYDGTTGDFIRRYDKPETGPYDMSLPTGLTFGPDGDLYVASCGSHNVLRFDGPIANFATIDGAQDDALPANNTGSAAVCVVGADLEITKSADPVTAFDGQTVTFTVEAINLGPEIAPDVTVTDVLDPGITIGSATASQGTYSIGTGIWMVGSLGVYDEGLDAPKATLTLVGTVDPGASDTIEVVTNTVTIDDSVQGDPNLDNNTAAAGVFLQFADLAITKTVQSPVSAMIREGDPVTFLITVEHLGRNQALNVRVRDRLPAGLQFISAVPSQGTYNPVTGVWDIGTLDYDQILMTGDTVTLLLTGVALPGTGGLTLTNMAEITRSSRPDPDLSNNVATADVTVLGADLQITKSASPPPYIEGELITFTLQVDNNGPEDAVNVIATDRLPNCLGYVSHSGGLYNPVSGQWTIGNLPNGGSATLTIIVRLLPGCGGSPVRNRATVDSDTGDQDLTNNADFVVIEAPSVDLDIVIVSRPGPLYPANESLEGSPDGDAAVDQDETPRPGPDPGPAIAGNALFYDVTVLNLGTGTATGVVFTATLEVDVRYIADNLVPSCVEGPVGFLTCQLGDIPGGGEKAFTIQTEVSPDAFVDRALAPEPLVLELFTGVVSNEPDLDDRNNVEVHLSLLQDLADVAIAKLSQPRTSVSAGEVFSYTIIVENLGPSTARDLIITDTLLASGAVALVALVPDPTRADTCQTVPAPAPQSGQLIACTLDEPLEPVGSGLGTGRWTVQVTARATEAMDILNEVRVASRDGLSARVGTPDPRLGNNVATDGIAVTSTADLQLTKTAIGQVHDPDDCAVVTSVADTVTAGDELVYTLVVTNLVPAFGLPGGSTASNVVVDDYLPHGLEVVAIAGTGPDGATGCVPGTPGIPGDPASCTFPELAPGESATVTLRVLVDHATIADSGTNLIQNGARASSDSYDPGANNNLVAHATLVTDVADLSILKLASPDPVIAGEVLSYELIVANAGPSTARDVILRDVLPATLAFQSARIENQRDREQCTFNAGAGEVICSLLDVPPGEPPAGGRRVFINTVVRSSTPPGAIGNTASVSSDGTPDCFDANNTAGVTVDVETQADLSIMKMVEPVKIAAGRQIKYSIWVTNLGPSDARDVVVTDTLPIEVDYEIDTNQPMCTASVNGAGNTVLTCQIGYLAAGASHHFDVWVRVRPEIPAGTTLTNTAVVSGFSSLGDPNPGNNTAIAKNFVLSVVDLRATKFGKNDGAVRAGEILTYTVIVDNLGPSFAEGVALKDVLQAGEEFDLIDITTNRPASCTSLTSGITETNAIAATAWPPVLPPPPFFGVIEPTGIPEIDQRLEVDCTLTEVLDPVFGQPQLGVLQADGPPNSGRWIITMRVRFRQAQDIDNIADVVSTSEELNPANNHAEVEHEISDVANLSITKTALGEVQVPGQPGLLFNTQASPAPALPQGPSYAGSATSVTAGRRIRYTLRIANAGPSDAENVIVTDRLPPGVTVLPGSVVVTIDNVAAPLPPGTCQTGTPGDPTDRLTCGLGTLLGVDNTVRRGATIVFDVLVDPNTPPGAVLENDATVSSDVFDPSSSNDHAHVQTVVTTAGDLSTSKTAVGQNVTGYDVPNQRFIIEDLPNSVTAGLELRYELSVQNAGPSRSRNVTLRDVLPAGVTFLRADGASCRPDPINAGTLYCALGDLPAGARATFDLYVLVDQAVPEGTVLVNCVDALFASATPPAQPPPLPGPPPTLTLTDDPFSANNRSCNNTTVNAAADVGGPGPGGEGNDFLEKRDIPAEPRLDRAFEPDLAVAGLEHRYRITFGNAGPSTALGVMITDTLDFKQVGILGETFLRCEALDPDDVVTCSFDPVTGIVKLESYTRQNEPIFVAGVGVLPPGMGFGFDLVVLVDPGYLLDADDVAPATVFNSEAGAHARNTVFISTITTDFRPQNNSDTERTRIIAEADLQLTKSDLVGDDFLSCDPVQPGDPVRYTLTVTNAGPSDAAEVWVVDQLPAGLLVVDPEMITVTVSAGEVVEVRDDGRISLRLGNDPNNEGQPELGRLNVGSTVTATIEVLTRRDLECGSLIANEARVETRRNDIVWPPVIVGPPAGGPAGPVPREPRTPTRDPNPANNLAIETTEVECPEITVRKTISFDGLCPGRDITLINDVAQPVTFCFEITNTGSTFLDDIRITDTLRTRSTMPTIIFTDTITFGVDPKVPVAPDETVIRKVTVPHLTRECGNAFDRVEVSANPVNSGRTDLTCLPIVTSADEARIEVPCLGVDFRLQLPILDNTDCETWLQVQNVGDAPTIPLLVVWGDPGACPPQSAGPLKSECSGLLRPGSAWSFATSQIPGGAHSAVMYSMSAEEVEEQPGQPIPFGLLVCDRVFATLLGSDLNWLIFDQAYRARGTYDGYDFGRYLSEPLAVVVNRNCPDPVDPNRSVNAAYTGVSSDLEGAYDIESGGYTFYAPLILSDLQGLNTVLHMQNSGDLCTSLEIWFKDQDNCLRPILGDVLNVARGETVTFDPGTVVGPGWIGSAWIRASQPMGLVIDTLGPNHFSSYLGVPGDVAVLDFSLGDQINYAPLVYNEHQGWDTLIQVQNLSGTVAAKIKVYFLDRSGGIVTTLVDWICPRGSQSYFIPVIANLPGTWVGSARVESQEWWTPGQPVVDPPRVLSVVLLERFSDPARSERREAVAYNASTETLYDWQLGNGKGGLASGSAVFALPMIAKGNRGVTSELAITNLVPKPGFTDFAMYLYDQNGLLDYLCQKLSQKEVEYINLDAWGWVRPNFLGSMVVSATFWEHDVFDDQGNFVRNLVGLGAVGVERIGGTLGEADVPGDESKAYESFPLFDHFLLEEAPDCP